MDKTVELGFYRHYKGGVYYVISVGRHSETQEQLVIYNKIFNDEIWIRPLTMFIEEIIIDNKLIKRFEKIDLPTVLSMQKSEDDHNDMLDRLSGTNYIINVLTTLI